MDIQRSNTQNKDNTQIRYIYNISHHDMIDSSLGTFSFGCIPLALTVRFNKNQLDCEQNKICHISSLIVNKSPVTNNNYNNNI